MKISYRSGKEGKKPDVLTRRSQDLPKRFDDSRQQHQFQTLLQADQLDDNVKKALAVAFCVNTTAEHGAESIGNDTEVIVDIVNEVDELDENDKPIINLEDYEGSQLISHPQHNQSTSEQRSSSAEAGSKIQNSNSETESESEIQH